MSDKSEPVSWWVVVLAATGGALLGAFAAYGFFAYLIFGLGWR